MTTTELTIRESRVFLAIVQGFIHNAEPVGSRYISKHFDLNISPATIRNVMTDLEEKGLICQPHTSAGRIPTTQGYRTYVDNLQRGGELADDEQRIIVEKLRLFSQDVDLIIGKAANVLGEISSLLGIVLSPRFIKGRLEKIELIQISTQKVLLLLSITSGLVKTIIIEIDKEFSPDFLMETAQVINERLHGLSVEQLAACFDERFTDLDDKSKTLIGAIKEKTGRVFQYEPEGEFHFSGAKNVIVNPEFDSAEKIGKILELLDRKDILVRVLSEQNSSGVSIVIGEENSEELMRNCSLITTTYSIDGAIGTLGVVGPTRMQYAKIISLVQFMSETLNYLVSKNN
jgi:heat-inducible transcriptional repressor